MKCQFMKLKKTEWEAHSLSFGCLVVFVVCRNFFFEVILLRGGTQQKDAQKNRNWIDEEEEVYLSRFRKRCCD